MDKSEVYAALWSTVRTNPAWALLIESVGCALRRIEPSARLWHHGPGQISGCTWNIFVDFEGKGLGSVGNPWPSDVWRAWCVALSYRGPFITALSWPEQGPADELTDPKLVQVVRGIAQSESLTYLDAHELMAWEVSWEELQGDAAMRLDWSDVPTAFNLLFYEY